MVMCVFFVCAIMDLLLNFHFERLGFSTHLCIYILSVTVLLHGNVDVRKWLISS